MKEEIFSHEINYLSANCNHKPHAFDLRGNLIVYPSCNSICVYDYVDHQHIQLLNGHNSQVNCVRWIKSVDSFVSASNGGQAIIWTKGDNGYIPECKLSVPDDGLINVHTIVTSLNCQGFKKNRVNYFTCASLTSEKVGLWFNDQFIDFIEMKQFIFDIRLIQSDQQMFGDVIFISLVGSGSMVHLMAFDENKNLHKLIELGGNEDWIQSVDIISINSNSLYLATGCQDHFIRVWKISRIDTNRSEKGRVAELLNNYFEVSIETILLGHEGWVYSVQFVENSSGKVGLLSASMDKSIVLWCQGEDDEIWTESIRVGDVGGSALGFVGALINPQLNLIIGQSFNGALHVWRNNKETGSWSPEVGLGGHWEIINDLSWEPNGNFLLTCSLDQTTRLHAPWARKESSKTTYHEIARPQIHGYDLNCITVIDGLTFASGADEKVIRIFGATKSFLQSFINISQEDLSKQLKVNRELPECASVPPLGLSNKAIYSEIDMDEYFKSVVLDKPPLEEILQQNTLWPEIEKLFGHSYELFTITCNHRGSLLASACKASKSESANLIIWNIGQNFKKLQELHFHSLTITQTRFSPNDRYLISVSRDRTWCLYELQDSESNVNIIKIGNTDKKTCLHSRIIWDVAWTPDNQYFVTCSRDKKAIVWGFGGVSGDGGPRNCLGPVMAISDHNLVLSDPIIAIDIARYRDSNGYVVAFGLENGNIKIYKWSIETNWKLKLSIDNCHTSQVKKLRFKPGNQSPDGLLLASCGDDRKTIIHKIVIN